MTIYNIHVLIGSRLVGLKKAGSGSGILNSDLHDPDPVKNLPDP